MLIHLGLEVGDRNQMVSVERIRIGRYEVALRNTGEKFEFAVLDKDGSLVRRDSADSRDNALAMAQSLISDVQSQQNSKRKNGIPTAEEFAESLSRIRPSDAQWEMLFAHYKAPNRQLSATQLSEAAGYGSFTAANSQYGALGRKLSEDLEFETPLHYDDGRPFWTSVLTLDNVPATDEDTGHFKHTMREEVARALEILGVKPS